LKLSGAVKIAIGKMKENFSQSIQIFYNHLILLHIVEAKKSGFGLDGSQTVP
jgi:hypothetical protein